MRMLLVVLLLLLLLLLLRCLLLLGRVGTRTLMIYLHLRCGELRWLRSHSHRRRSALGTGVEVRTLGG